MKRKKHKQSTEQQRRRAARRTALQEYYALPVPAFIKPGPTHFKPVCISREQLKVHKRLIHLLVTERGTRFKITS